MVKGIDVSEFQGNIDWKKVRESGIEFAILRAGYGNELSQKDACFERNAEEAYAAGVKMGAYWFSYAVNEEDAKKEAQVCAQVLEKYKGKLEYPVWFDYEYASCEYAQKQGVTPTRELITAMTKAFIGELRSCGWYAGYYTNPDYRKNKYGDMTGYELWYAWYSEKSEPDTVCGLQQYTASGRVPGISGNVDLDFGRKDYPSIIRAGNWNGFTSGSVPVPETPKCRVTSPDVLLYADAETASDILSVLGRDEEVIFLADDKWGWSKVRAGTVAGYCKNIYLSRSGLSSYKTAVLKGNDVNVRRSPEISGKVITRLSAGEKLTVVCILPNNWLEVYYETDTKLRMQGYVYYDKSYITIG